MNFYVYILGTLKKPIKTYVGWTNDLKRRISKHNSGKGAKFTRGRKWKLLYSEKLNSKSNALKKEHKLKKNFKFRKFLRENFNE